jgi:hypothetical protein
VRTTLAVQGSTLHRQGGLLFVYVMVTSAIFGMVMAVGRDVAPAINVPAGLLTAYLVITSLATVRPPTAGSQWLNLGALLVTSAVALSSRGRARGRIGLPGSPDRNTAGIRDKPRHPQCDDRRPGALAVAPRQSPASLRADRLIRPAGRATANVS